MPAPSIFRRSTNPRCSHSHRARRAVSGFQSSYAREGLAALLYTDRLNPRGAAQSRSQSDARRIRRRAKSPSRAFRSRFAREDEERHRARIGARTYGVTDFFVLNPGGGWRSKCWPAQRYGELHRKLAERYGWRGVVSFGPGEEDLAREVVASCGRSRAGANSARSRSVDGADAPREIHRVRRYGAAASRCRTGRARGRPLRSHRSLAQRPVFARSALHIVVRNPRNCETTYRRGKTYSPAMLSIAVQQVFDAVERRWGSDS